MGKSKLISTQTDKISQQTENWENRNEPDLVHACVHRCVAASTVATSLVMGIVKLYWLFLSSCYLKDWV